MLRDYFIRLLPYYTRTSVKDTIEVHCKQILCKKVYEKCMPKHTSAHTSARPEVRGTVDVGWRSLFPFRSILLVLTHVFIIICVYGPTGSDGHERKDADAALRTIFVPFETQGVMYDWGPSS